MEALCGLTDPFCAHADNVKYPDSSAARSLPLKQHYTFTIAIGATVSTNNSVLFVPGYQNGYATGTGNPSSYAGNFNANPSISAGVVGYRIVSSGLRIRSMCAPLNASGIVQIRGFAAPNSSTLVSIGNDSFNCDFYQDIPLQSINLNGYTDILVRRIDEVGSRQFVAPLTTNPTPATNNWFSPGWGAVTITVVGGPINTTVLQVEVFNHHEVVIDDSDILAVAMTKAPMANPMLTQAAAWIVDTAGSVFHEVGKDATSVITNLAQRAFRKGAVRMAGSALPMLM